MIEIIIKTLDSQNHSFSVDDETTVKQLKEHIAAPINVPVESQRLIYCGRVLVDDKKLSEYDVNGKVIHLVQRAPPSSSTSSSTSATSGEGRGHGPRRPAWRLVGPSTRVEGGSNAMYLGAMAFPADLMDAQGITMPQPRQGLSQSRLSVVRTMLRRARYVLQSLENPSHQESPGETNGSISAEEIGIAMAAMVNQHFNNEGQPEGGLSSREEGGAEVPGDQATPQPTEEPPQQSASGPSSGRPSGTAALAELISQLRELQRRFQPFLDQYYELMRDDPALESPSEAQRIFTQVSEIMHFLAHAYHALSDVMCDLTQPRPRVLRCRPVLIQHSAVLHAGIPVVSRFNLSASTSSSGSQPQATQTVVASTPMPEATAVEVEAASSAVAPEGTFFRRPFGPRDPGAELGASSRYGFRRLSRVEPVGPAPDPSRRRHFVRSRFRDASSADVPRRDLSAQMGASGQRVYIDSGDFEIYMEVEPNTTLETLERTLPNTTSANSVDATGGGAYSIDATGGGAYPIDATGGGGYSIDATGAGADDLSIDAAGGGPFSIGAAVRGLFSNDATGGGAYATFTGAAANQPPPEFIQNLISMMQGQIMAAGGIQVAASVDVPASSEGASSPPTSGQTPAGTNSQARGNTATHPTTATQTRSTPRPHVHFPGIQNSMSGQAFFDPFLPCNSHHIRSSRRRAQSQVGETTQEQTTQTSTTSTPSAPGSSQSASSNGAAGIDPETPRRGPVDLLAFLSNTLGGRQGHSSENRSRPVPSVIRILPRDITILLQSAPNDLINVSTHLSDVVNGILVTPYVSGQSVIMDLFMTAARHITVAELITSISGGIGPLLLAVRQPLSRFINENLLRGSERMELLTEGIDRINADLRPHLESMEIPMRSDVDFVASVNRVNHRHLNFMFRTIVRARDSEYVEQMTNEINTYLRSLVAVFIHCCNTGSNGVENLFTVISRRLGNNARMTSFHTFTVNHILNEIRNHMTNNDIPQDVLQSYLVYRMSDANVSNPEAPASEEASAIPLPQAPPPTPPQVLGSTEAPQNHHSLLQPMETESPTEDGVAGVQEAEPPLPDVIIGAEPWHSALPPDWVPIITRDRERQRRQAVQGPLSEAYLSGMPSKRRKVVASAKPHGTLARVISESMATALVSAGVPSVDGLPEVAGADSSIRAAYKEQVRTTVEATLRNHPDYKPEKYPNAAKYFDRQ